MKVLVPVTRSCGHRPILERKLAEMGIEHEVKYVEDHPGLQERFGVTTSPNLIVDDTLIFAGWPEAAELKASLESLEARARTERREEGPRKA